MENAKAMTADSETPLTDAAAIRVWWSIDDQSYCGIEDEGEYIHADFARALETRLRQAEADLVKARVNEGRYRWLRDIANQGAKSADGEGLLVVTDSPSAMTRYVGPLSGQHLDAAIDRAMKGK